MCRKSESIKNIAVALVKFNAEVPKIEKDSTNPHFKNKYASLDGIIEDIRPILTKHGLSIIQMPGGDGELFTMTTMLIHESGEWIESDPIKMRPVKNDPQGIGSCATYARRYSLAAFLSLNTGEDDDGHQASQPSQRPVQTQQHSQQRQAPPPANDDHAAIQQASEVNRSGQGQPSGGAAAARVYALRERVGLSWPDLNVLASNVLGREVKYLKSNVKTEEEWQKIENALKEAG